MALRAIKQSDGSLVYPIYNGLVDVFTGDGWKNRSRYLYVKGKGWVLTAGTRVDLTNLKLPIQ